VLKEKEEVSGKVGVSLHAARTRKLERVGGKGDKSLAVRWRLSGLVCLRKVGGAAHTMPRAWIGEFREREKQCGKKRTYEGPGTSSTEGEKGEENRRGSAERIWKARIVEEKGE